jgi:hypothetical protein
MLCSLDYEDGKYLLHVSNDSLTESAAQVEISRIRRDGAEKIFESELICPANDKTAIELPLTLAEDEILVADLCSKENPDRAFYKHGDLNIVPAEGAVDMYADDGEVVLSARDYVHAVELCGEAVFSDNGFSMKKGEVKRIEVRFLPDSANTKITVEAYTLKAFI